MHRTFKEDLFDISQNAVKPTKVFSVENLTSQSSKVATLCGAGEIVSTAFGMPGVGTAVGTIIGLLMR